MIAFILDLQAGGGGGGGGGGGNQPGDTAAPYLSLITSEYNQQPAFMALADVLCAGVGDVTAGIEAIQPAFDLDAAVGAQLDIVGLWVGQPRIVPNVLVFGFFGFADDPAALQFGELGNPSVGGKFYELGEVFSGTTVLADPDYLTVIKARIVRNQSNGTLSAIENALQFIFGVPSYVVDMGTLSLALTVASQVTPTDEALLLGLDLLPRPAGVEIGSIVFQSALLGPPPNTRAQPYVPIINAWPPVTWSTQQPRKN
jgi:hypothetical protein